MINNSEEVPFIDKHKKRYHVKPFCLKPFSQLPKNKYYKQQLRKNTIILTCPAAAPSWPSQTYVVDGLLPGWQPAGGKHCKP